MSRWDSLLAVQEHDTALDQLAHRRTAMPERGALDAAMSAISATDAEAAGVEEQRHELVRAQSRLEDEIATLADKAKRDDARLYDGSVSNPRELQALQEEIGALKRRIGQLEDQEIELMEQIEPLDAELARLAGVRSALDEESVGLRATIAEAEVTIDADTSTVRAERDELAAGIAPDLLAEYERIRAQQGGIAIARLAGGSCGGCHLALSAVEVDRIGKLPPDEPARCEECGRLLAR